jgi:hypothetical protein
MATSVTNLLEASTEQKTSSYNTLRAKFDADRVRSDRTMIERQNDFWRRMKQPDMIKALPEEQLTGITSDPNISGKAQEQEKLLGDLLKKQKSRNEEFTNKLAEQQTKLGTMFDDITSSFQKQQEADKAEAARAKEAADKQKADAAAALTGPDRQLGQGDRGRATETTELITAPEQGGGSRAGTFLGTAF